MNTDRENGIEFLTDFWEEKYLKEYIRYGGSKIKFVTGRKGSGKSYFLMQMQKIASASNYKTASFSAKEIWLHDFKDIYVEILHQVDLMDCLANCSLQIIKDMGFDPSEIEPEQTFIDYLSAQNLSDALTRREIRTQLKTMFLDNPLLDNNFALACSMLTGSLLGYPVLEPQNKQLLLSWLEGDRTVKLALLRSLGLSPTKITRYNARHMLRSLSEVIHIGGYPGLFVTIDDLEILISKSSLESIHYTKLKREDTYESIRQLIDDIDSLHNLMFVFSFDRDLIDNENTGIKSYQALWMRIQNEIVSQHYNRFTDIADLDLMAAQEYTPSILLNISRHLADSHRISAPISETQASDILSRASLGNIGIPGLIKQMMQEGYSNE